MADEDDVVAEGEADPPAAPEDDKLLLEADAARRRKVRV